MAQKSRFLNRLPKANDILQSLDSGLVLQPSIVSKGRSSRTNSIDDEDNIPEAVLDYGSTIQSPTSDLTNELLEGLAATDEIGDAIQRITSYIVIVPEIGTSFAYPQLNDSFDVEPEQRDALMTAINQHWKILEDLMFSTFSSLTIGIHEFINNWFTYGELFYGIVRDKPNGNILKIIWSTEPFLQKTDRDGSVYYDSSDGLYHFWDVNDIISLKYTEINKFHKSYVGSLRYAYNTYKSIERTRIANAIMAAQFRSIYTVPTKGLGKIKARQRLSTVMGLYKRNINIDKSSGEVLVNGENTYPVNTELWISETSSGSVRIENPGDGNPQLNDTELVEYFFRRFYKQAKLPVSKYEAVNTGYLNGLSELDEDERQFRLAIAKHRSVLAKFFISLLWRLLEPLKEFTGRNDIRNALIFTFYDEPEHKTNEELLDGIGDRLDKVNSIIDKYTETLEKSGFGKSQILARCNVLRFKLLSKYLPDILEQTKEDYRNVPEQETSGTDDGSDFDSFNSSDDFGESDFSSAFGDDWSSESGYDDGNDSMDDWSDDDISNEVNFDSWNFDETDNW